MDWPGFKNSPQSFSLVIGVIALILIVFWVLKIRNISRLRVGVVQLETKLSKGQELWRDYPPLTPEERRDLEKAQERLFRMLPRDKDIPPLLQEIGRLAREYSLTNVSFNIGDGAAPPGTSQQPASAAPKVQESSGPIASFPLKVTFDGDYQEIAYFLKALQKIPRLMTIQSLRLQRGIPLVVAEVVLKAYYQRATSR